MVLLTFACESERTRECDFGEAFELFGAGEQGFAGLEVLARDDGRFDALYSVREGLFRISVEQGQPGQPVRLGAACDELEAAAGSDVVACARLPHPEKDATGTITLLRLGEQELSQVTLPWPIGVHHAGLSIAKNEDTFELVFHDGRAGAFSVWHAALDAALRPMGEPRLISAAAIDAGAPHIAIEDDTRFITWTEGWIERDPNFADYAGQVMLMQSPAGGPLRGSARRVTEVHHSPAQPFVAVMEGTPVLLFRDVRAPHRRPGLFAINLRSEEDARRVGRSNGPARPHALVCGDSLITSTPRSFGRTDVLIGIHLLDERLEDRVAEQQVYEYAAQFVDSATHCADDALWLLVGERSRLDGRPAKLHLMPLVCD